MGESDRLVGSTSAGQHCRRSYTARAGIAALNLLAPGLGLVRIGDRRAGVIALFAPFVPIAMIAFGLGHFPMTSYGRVMLALGVVILGLILIYVVPITLTWRRSEFRRPIRRWSRWYGLAAIFVAYQLVLECARSWVWYFDKPFYAPGESMAPTIGKGDKFIANMRWRGPIKRGDIVIFHGPDNIRVSRIVAIGGDRVAMRAGVPVINGIAATRSTLGRATFTGFDGVASGVVSSERLPGEDASHRVIDQGVSEFDDMNERVVPTGRVFVLGDNRDRSADSRVPADLAGVGMVPLSAIVGRPLYIHWSADRAQIGVQLHSQR